MKKPLWRTEHCSNRFNRPRLAAFEEQNAVGPYHQVVFTGDSLTHAFEVQNFCKEFGPDGPIVYNRGISGYTTLDVLSALDVMVTDIKPRRLFFNIGTNDMG